MTSVPLENSASVFVSTLDNSLGTTEISSKDIKCSYQVDHSVHGPPDSGDCGRCRTDYRNLDCNGFRAVVPLENMIARFANSPVVYCPFYDNDVPISGACYLVSDHCRFFKGAKTTELGNVVLCGYVGQKEVSD